MNVGNIMLEILSPEKTIFKGAVSRIYIPGKKDPFLILHNHAPIISSIDKGTIKWEFEEGEQSLIVDGGFIEAGNNNVTICIETVK